MFQKLKQDAIVALRSGQYTQIKERMKDATASGRCANGVIADCHAKAMGMEFWSAAIDLTSDGTHPFPAKTFVAIADLNDAGCSFQFIADVLEYEFNDQFLPVVVAVAA